MKAWNMRRDIRRMDRERKVSIIYLAWDPVVVAKLKERSGAK
jgi:hypothetical protein